MEVKVWQQFDLFWVESLSHYNFYWLRIALGVADDDDDDDLDDGGGDADASVIGLAATVVDADRNGHVCGLNSIDD
jgi:hypothetical protein